MILTQFFFITRVRLLPSLTQVCVWNTAVRFEFAFSRRTTGKSVTAQPKSYGEEISVMKSAPNAEYVNSNIMLDEKTAKFNTNAFPDDRHDIYENMPVDLQR